MQNSYTLKIAGGGTGGHLFPGIAVAEYLKNDGKTSFFIVTDRGLERKILSAKGFDFYEQRQCPLNNVSTGRKIKSLFNLSVELLKVSRMIKKGDKVLLTGGFAAAAAAVVSRFKGAQLYLHEQNSVMGLTNRKFAGYCKKVFVSFEYTENAPENAVHTGNPVRAEFAEMRPKDTVGKKVLVLGGSQGSRFLNNLILSSVDKLIENGYEILLQAGDNLYDETVKNFEKSGLFPQKKVKIVRFIDDVISVYTDADFIVARSGAGSVFETVYSRRAAVFVPFAQAADNHQLFNAKYAEGKGVAKVMTESEADADKLLENLTFLHSNYRDIKHNLDKIRFKDSAKLISEGMEIG